MILMLLACIGLALSAYGLFIEYNLQRNPSYKPMCDVSDYVSCSKPLSSSYSSLFIVSNTVAGLVFYALIFIFALFEYTTLIFYASCGAMLVSFVLAYLLFVKIKAFCLLCTALYVVNVGLLISSYLS